MSKTKVVISGVVWTIIQNIVNILYGIVSVPFLINYFGKDYYGLIGLAISVNVYMQLLDLGMNNSNVKFFSEYLAQNDKERIQKLFSLTYLFYTLIGLVNALILFGFSFFIDTVFKVSPEQSVTLRNLIWILMLNAIFSWISVCLDQFLRAHDNIDWIKKRLTLLKLLQFAFLWATILLHFSIEIYFFGYIFMATLILPWTIIKAKRVMPDLKIKWGYDKEMLKAVMPYALGIFSFGMFSYFAFNFRPLFLGGFSGPGSVAEFNIMNTVAMVVTIISGSFMQVLLPIVTKMRVNKEEQGIQKVIFTGTKYVTIILCIIVFILIVNIDDIFTLYVGKEYTSLSSWMILWLLTLLLSNRNVMTSLVFTEKKIKSVAIMGAVSMCFALGCYITLIPLFGVGGVVIGFVVYEIIHTLFYYVYFIPVKFNINTRKLFNKIVGPIWVLYSIISILIIYLLKNLNYSLLINISIKSLTCLLIFMGVSWLLFFDSKDKEFTFNFIRKLKSK